MTLLAALIDCDPQRRPSSIALQRHSLLTHQFVPAALPAISIRQVCQMLLSLESHCVHVTRFVETVPHAFLLMASPHRPGPHANGDFPAAYYRLVVM
jgi:hypothetical protein